MSRQSARQLILTLAGSGINKEAGSENQELGKTTQKPKPWTDISTLWEDMTLNSLGAKVFGAPARALGAASVNIPRWFSNYDNVGDKAIHRGGKILSPEELAEYAADPLDLKNSGKYLEDSDLELGRRKFRSNDRGKMRFHSGRVLPKGEAAALGNKAKNYVKAEPVNSNEKATTPYYAELSDKWYQLRSKHEQEMLMREALPRSELERGNHGILDAISDRTGLTPNQLKFGGTALGLAGLAFLINRYNARKREK